MFKGRAKNGLSIKSLILHLEINGNSAVFLNSNSAELELHRVTQEESYLSV